MLPDDFRDLLALLRSYDVEYLVVGAYALAFHGIPRYTGDLDIWIRPTPDNATRLLRALDAFGFGGLSLTSSDFEQPDQIVQLGYPPVRIDLITSISGVTWDDAWAGREEGTYAEVPAVFLGLAALKTNKRASGRPKDLVDLETLERARPRG